MTEDVLLTTLVSRETVRSRWNLTGLLSFVGGTSLSQSQRARALRRPQWRNDAWAARLTPSFVLLFVSATFGIVDMIVVNTATGIDGQTTALLHVFDRVLRALNTLTIIASGVFAASVIARDTTCNSPPYDDAVYDRLVYQSGEDRLYDPQTQRSAPATHSGLLYLMTWQN